MGGFASCFQKNFLYTYQVCMFPEKHQGTLREHMSCGVQLSAQPSIYIYISQQSMFWRNSWVLGIPTSHILTACKPIYIRCWFRVVAKIYISTRDVSPKNEGTIGLWGTPALYLPHSNRLQNHVCFPKITTVLKEHRASHILTVCNTNYVSKKNYFIFNGMRGFV